MRLSKKLLAAAAVVAAGATQAAPTTITVLDGAPIPVVPSTISFDSGFSYTKKSVLEYIIKSTEPKGTFAAFCLEPLEHLFPVALYDNGGTFTTAQADGLSKLFTGANWQSWNFAADGVTQSYQRVGLGLAVWDLFIDNGVLDFNGGTLRVSNDGFGGAAIAFAQSSFAAGNLSMVPNLIHLTARGKQDLIIAVPEPTTYTLMFAGLLAIGFVARRRSR